MPESLCSHFQMQVERDPSGVALSTSDGRTEITWDRYGEEVRLVAAGLAALGVGRGDVVGLMLANRPEFHVVDAAAMHLGAIGFSVYNTSTVEQIRYLFGNAEPAVVVTEAQFLPRVREAAEGSVKQLVTVDGEEGTLSLAELVRRGRELSHFDFDAAWRSVGRDDVLTLIYTSGTTGDPKGVELTHGNLLYQLDEITGVTGDLSDGRFVSYLPDAHLINRWICQYAPMYFGGTVTDVDDPKTLIRVLGEVHPTFFCAVPMLWYKIKGAVEATIDAQGEAGRAALAAGQRRAAAVVAGEALTAEELAAAEEADQQVFSRVRASLGFDQLVSCTSGAAPIDVAVLEFMLAVGVPVMEAWGMSETSAVTTVNPIDAPRYGTVGKAIPGTEVVLADDGEVLVRGPGIMRGYRNDPQRTADTLDRDGWVHTGDIGVLDDEGYLSIVDRKKEMIINSGGKNMSPSNIEGALKAASPLIGSVVAIGDNRPHVSALITLDPDAGALLAAELGLEDPAADALADHPAVVAVIAGAVEVANTRLSRVEHIRSWRVLPTYWLPGGEELTPTMKLKRSPINAKYATEIEALYASKD